MNKKNEIKKAWWQRDTVVGYVFILPFVIGFLCFTLIPICSSFYYSFTNYNLLNNPKMTGLNNYIRMFTNDPTYLKSVKVTLLYVVLSVPLRLVFALLVAVLLNSGKKFTGFYRALYYLPTLVGGSIAISVTWKLMFQTDGLINHLLRMIGIDSHVGWLTTPSTALGVLIGLSIWQFGASMIIFLAGLKNIPAIYYEAASVDGANGLVKFFKITLPMLSPVIFFNLIMTLINGFVNFTQAYVITAGKPVNSTLMYVMYLYNQAFRHGNMGYSSAMAWAMLVVIAIFTGLIFKSSDAWVYYESSAAGGSKKRGRRARHVKKE